MIRDTTTRATRRRMTHPPIEIGGNGKPRGRWKRWLKAALDTATKAMAIYAFIRTWGWRVTLALIAGASLFATSLA
jgi:hypothetical protein